MTPAVAPAPSILSCGAVWARADLLVDRRIDSSRACGCGGVQSAIRFQKPCSSGGASLVLVHVVLRVTLTRLGEEALPTLRWELVLS